MNELDEIYNIQEKWDGLVKDINLPKSQGKYEEFNKGLVFYLFDLHIETNIYGNKDKDKKIINLVDRIIQESPELYAILQHKKIKNDAVKLASLNNRLTHLQKKIDFFNGKEELTREEKKEKRVLIKEESQLSQEIISFNERYKKVEEEVFKGVSEKAKSFAITHNDFFVILGGDISDNIENASVFYHRLREWIPSEFMIMAVLGNHELSRYASVEAALAEYKTILDRENILLLQNNGYADYFAFRDEEKWIAEHGISKWPQKIHSLDNLVFWGGIGFNRFNNTYNANSIITSADLQGNIEKEKEKCNEYLEAYNKALEYTKYAQKVMVVISHYPLRDWINESECDNACYYFCGHNHKNESFKSNGAYIFADNQIGYYAKTISFKYIELFGLYNPFYQYEDGEYSVFLDDYELFYKVAGEGTIGKKKIFKYINDGYELKMIKKNGCYGFFIVGKSKVFICKGGNIERLDKNFEYYCTRFDKMVSKYIEKLAPFRKYQMELAEEVKNIGGQGKIHGLIVDYDCYHHIMISPTDNRLFFYFSPEDKYRKVMDLKHVVGLLNHKGLNKSTRTEYLMNIQPGSILSSYIPTEAELEKNEGNEATLQRIDIKKSPYMISIRMRNLERIFTSGILRDWDDRLIDDFLMETSSSGRLCDSDSESVD